mmetsp:Transcript_8435/g.12871  ORF Transcript_8435/g.12871 Transcript_8435/m.12871 type:complete len:80 (+) Transcript_8435:2021-2260(+)
MIASHNQNLVKENNFKNLTFLADQIKSNRLRRDQQHTVDKQYYKPHFGPEETDDTLNEDWARTHNQKHFIKGQLISQIT